MAISSKDFKSTVTKSKVEVQIDLAKELEGLSRSEQTKLKNIVGDTLIKAVKDKSAKQTSSVNQRGANQFKKLSPEYKALKKAQGAGTKANLKLKGDMLNSIFNKKLKDSIKLKITNSTEKKKAENHNHGVTGPKRQFLPTKDNQAFTRDIMKDVNKKIREFKKDASKGN